jgi:hypothetical protein
MPSPEDARGAVLNLDTQVRGAPTPIRFDPMAVRQPDSTPIP